MNQLIDLVFDACVTQGSSYQLVLVSDALTTYALFNYDNVEVQYQLPSVHMGYTDPSGHCLSSYLSGSDAMDHFERVSCDVTG